jgi:putative hydrolase of the HAD superfamily
MHYLIRDIDGTLIYRDGMWSGTLLEILDREIPGHACTLAQIRPYMQAGFPWHLPEQPHIQLTSADQWWESLLPHFEASCTALGFPKQAAQLACQVRTQYLDPTRWHCFDDTVATLEQLAQAGWTHVALSNHVPELSSILEQLQLHQHFTYVFNSAETGYEKPHPRMFQMVLNTIEPYERIWMIGDSISADIGGAAAAGIPAILVRTAPPPHIRHWCATLVDVPALLEQYA